MGTWGLWKRRFGAEPGIVNQTVHINSRPYTVIGVLPAWFVFPKDPSVELLTAVNHDKPAEWMESLVHHPFAVTGRLHPDITPEQATEDLALITGRVNDAHREIPDIGKSAIVRPLLEDMEGNARQTLYVLFAATSCILVIACLNVANLLVARGAARSREHAIRMALGGGRLGLLVCVGVGWRGLRWSGWRKRDRT